jgi:hypothetical protein
MVSLLDIHQDHFEGEIKVVMVTSVDRADKEKKPHSIP